ncbi:MAG: 50S ribosomal protein L6 [Planctomycetes bacterium]|nr:50S ribosomal protein L6 [Planctomycetota bacterium]
MSRIGKAPVAVPAGVEFKINARQLGVKGPKGTLKFEHHPLVTVSYDDKARSIEVKRVSDERLARSVHGLTRTLISNMIEGVTKGYERRLVVIGLGYKAELDKKDKRIVLLKVGYANTVGVRAPEGVTVEIGETSYKVEGSGEEKVACITVRGADKQVVGQYAADLRAVQPAEPYQGKGVRYFGEVVRRKEGKTKGA